MPIIRVYDNEKNRWQRNPKTKKNKARKKQGGTEAIVKKWELNDFFEYSS